MNQSRVFIVILKNACKYELISPKYRLGHEYKEAADDESIICFIKTNGENTSSERNFRRLMRCLCFAARFTW